MTQHEGIAQVLHDEARRLQAIEANSDAGLVGGVSHPDSIPGEPTGPVVLQNPLAASYKGNGPELFHKIVGDKDPDTRPLSERLKAFYSGKDPEDTRGTPRPYTGHIPVGGEAPEGPPHELKAARRFAAMKRPIEQSDPRPGAYTDTGDVPGPTTLTPIVVEQVAPTTETNQRVEKPGLARFIGALASKLRGGSNHSTGSVNYSMTQETHTELQKAFGPDAADRHSGHGML